MFDAHTHIGGAAASTEAGRGAAGAVVVGGSPRRRVDSSELLLTRLQSCVAAAQALPNGGGSSAAAAVASPGRGDVAWGIDTIVEQRRAELTVAGELGIELLDKNARLRLQSESIRQHYTAEAEALRLDGGKLRRRLALAEEELQVARREHDAAASEMKRRLEQQRLTAATAQRESLRSAELLRQQNERLSAELQAVASKEPRLVKEASALRDELMRRRRSDDVLRQRLDDLAELNAQLRSKQSQLESDRQRAAAENSALDTWCAQLQQKAAWLERKNAGLSEQVTSAARQLADLQERVAALEAHLEISAVSDSEVFGAEAHGQSLLEELEISQRSHTSGYESTQSIDEDLDRLDGAFSTDLSPALPLDAYGQLQVDVHDAVELLKQATASMAANALCNGDAVDCGGNGSEELSAGELLLSLVSNAQRFVGELRAPGSAEAPIEAGSASTSAHGSCREEVELSGRLSDLRSECHALREASARDEERAAGLRRERDEARAACEEAFVELLHVKNELMSRENDLLETTQARLRLARQRDLWMADMAEAVKAQVDRDLANDAAVSRPRPQPPPPPQRETKKKSVRSLFR